MFYCHLQYFLCFDAGIKDGSLVKIITFALNVFDSLFKYIDRDQWIVTPQTNILSVLLKFSRSASWVIKYQWYIVNKMLRSSVSAQQLEGCVGLREQECVTFTLCQQRWLVARGSEFMLWYFTTLLFHLKSQPVFLSRRNTVCVLSVFFATLGKADWVI